MTARRRTVVDPEQRIRFVIPFPFDPLESVALTSTEGFDARVQTGRICPYDMLRLASDLEDDGPWAEKNRRWTSFSSAVIDGAREHAISVPATMTCSRPMRRNRVLRPLS